MRKVIVLFIIMLSKVVLSYGQSMIQFDEKTDSYIGKEVILYQDTSNKLTFNDVKNQPGIFSTSATEVINLGLTDFNSWLKFTVLNNSSKNKVILNLSYPLIDDVTLYYILENKIDSIHISGSDPIQNRVYKHQFYVFDIPVNRGDTVNCYLKLSGNKQIMAPLTLNTPENLLSYIVNADTVSGIYFGIMLVMLFYNLFIYFSTKDKNYLLYVHYIFWVTLTQATLLGYSHKYFWTDNEWLNNHITPFMGAMAGITTIIFSKSFLHTKVYVSKLNSLLNFIIGGYLISIILLLVNKPLLSYNFVNANAGIGSLLVIYAAYSVYKENYKPAKFFLIGFTVFLLFTCMFVMKDYEILPYNFVTIHSLQIGSAIESVLLSFALAFSINTLKAEKEQSQADLLLSAQENARIIREQNVILEAKVEERTEELSAANEEINQALIDLKEAEGQLVEAEKMASLGQLTAGIAHEINNPINFVTSNVNPLRRDIDLLFDTIEKMEIVGLSDDTDKQQQIDDYKEEIDYDYLKVEIAHLLNGIHDGASRTAEIVKGLRIFSRLDEDDLKKADLNEGLDSTLIIVNNLLNNKIVIEKHYGDIPVIDCYPGKLNQVFLNILSNAIFAVAKKFENKEGGIIKITTENKENGISIKIEDNGIGMDDLTKKKIFEPFFTTKDVGEGTGLGMSIAFNTIRRHEGEIIVNSTPGLGTEFILELPLVIKGLEIVE